MDPLTQGALGASFSQSLSNKTHLGIAGILGLLSGMTPDLDIFIRSKQDPLLFLEYHRQFTHSLIFIPFGGALCAIFFYYLFSRRWQLSFKQTYLYCTLGYATHALLDACTSYGTQLFWPFSTQRISWDTVSIIDPLLTLPLVILIIVATIKKQPRYALAGLLWVITYQGIGFIQNQRASQMGWQLAENRNHTPIRLNAKPSFGNILLWRIVYETEDGFYTDGIRAGLKLKIYPGVFTRKLNTKRDFAWLHADSQQAKDLKRFSWFSQDYVAVDPNNENRVFDARYSLLPNEAKGLWSIHLNPKSGQDGHAEYKQDRDIKVNKRETFIKMLKGEDL